MEILKHFFEYYSSKNAKGGVENFSFLHFSWFIITVSCILGVVYIYINLNEKSKNKLIKVFVIFNVVVFFLRTFWTLLLGKFSMDSMLPLHLCGMMVFIDFMGVFTNHRLIKEFAYSVGLPGAFVALLTPELNGYPLFSFQYQAFIFTHALLVLIPLLWVFGDGYRPSEKYFLKVFGVLCSLAAFDGIINSLLHSNYMFISKAPIGTPFVFIEESFGYSGYLVFLFVTVFIVLKLMYKPFKQGKNKKFHINIYKP